MSYDKFKCDECSECVCELFTTEPAKLSSGTRIPEKCPWSVCTPDWKEIKTGDLRDGL